MAAVIPLSRRIATRLLDVYAVMVLPEESWLAAAYGAPCQRYCRRVPRFFNWRRGFVLMRAIMRGQS